MFNIYKLFFVIVTAYLHVIVVTAVLDFGSFSKSGSSKNPTGAG